MTFTKPDDWSSKMAFGFALLLVFAVLAGAIALGKVEEKTSFGLQGIINGLMFMAGNWSGWAFKKDEV
jgi:hypothetical protein